MSEVKRYNVFAYLEDGGEPELDRCESQSGTYVMASDYDALAAECERVRAANLDCVDHFNQAMAARDAALAELATVKKVAYGNLDLLKENERVKAELAALKGGQEAVAFVCEASSTHHGCPEGYGDILSEWLPVGTEIYTAPPAQASAWVAERYTCIGKGGDYQLLGLAQGAGTLKGFNHIVYRNRDGVMFVREPEDFLSRMEKVAPTPGASDGKDGEK